jgi:hypothetical protein
MCHSSATRCIWIIVVEGVYKYCPCLVKSIKQDIPLNNIVVSVPTTSSSSSSVKEMVRQRNCNYKDEGEYHDFF